MVLLPLVLLLDATLVSGITPKLDGLRLAPNQLIDPDQPNDNDKLTAVSIDYLTSWPKSDPNLSQICPKTNPNLSQIRPKSDLKLKKWPVLNFNIQEGKFIIGKVYDLIVFGEGIGNAEFVLTQENVEANADCNSFGHTQKTRIQSLSDQLSNGLDYDQVCFLGGVFEFFHFLAPNCQKTTKIIYSE